MNSIIHLSVQQLRRAASIKGKIQSLENQLIRLFGSDGATKKPVAKKRRKMSAAGRARIAAAARARWKKAKAAGKKRL
jgi:hypothetical protein